MMFIMLERLQSIYVIDTQMNELSRRQYNIKRAHLQTGVVVLQVIPDSSH